MAMSPQRVLSKLKSTYDWARADSESHDEESFRFALVDDWNAFKKVEFGHDEVIAVSIDDRGLFAEELLELARPGVLRSHDPSCLIFRIIDRDAESREAAAFVRRGPGLSEAEISAAVRYGTYDPDAARLLAAVNSALVRSGSSTRAASRAPGGLRFSGSTAPFRERKMGDLILTKHAEPEIVRGAPSSKWVLSSRGAMQCRDLAAGLARYHPSSIVSSREPKARQTAKLIGIRLGLPARGCPDLHENDRSGFTFFENRDEFEERLREFFFTPGERIIGEESADEAHTRFSAAIRSATASSVDLTTVVVSHGAVISLLVARANEMDPYSLWQSLGFTSFVVVSTPDLGIQDIVHPQDA